MKERLALGFVGGGKMAEAIIRGLTRSRKVTGRGIAVFEISAPRCAYLRERYGVSAAKSLSALVSRSTIVVLAVKPLDLPPVLDAIAPVIGQRPVVSIAAGVTIKTIAAHLRRDSGIIRVMPNTPAIVGEGASAYCTGPDVDEKAVEIVEKILSSVGTAVRLKESMIDAVTALSGSGPAYFLLVIEALIDAGVRIGLPRDVATTLTLQTALGSAFMAMRLGEHPAALRDMVTSPGGTTAAALEVLEASGLRGQIVRAVVAAKTRAQEISALMER